jgi:hypothetical protein
LLNQQRGGAGGVSIGQTTIAATSVPSLASSHIATALWLMSDQMSLA